MLKTTFLFLSIILTHGLVAQTWQNRGPNGGFFKDFVIHPSNPNIVYAGSDDGGGVWKTTNGGDSWQLLTADYPNFTGWHIEIDQNHPDTLYFCELYGRYGILKTTDGGETLTHQTSGFVYDRDLQTTQLAIYPGVGDTLFVSTGEGDNYGRVGNGVFKSVNGGNTWNYSGLQDTSVHCIHVSSIGRILAGTDNHGLFFSDNLGETWVQHPDIPDTATVLQMDEKDGAIALSGAANGVFVSFDNGVSFVNIGMVGEFNFDLTILATSPYLKIMSSGFFHPNYFTSETFAWSAMDDPLLEDQLLIGVEGDENLIYAGIFSSTQILKSADGGNTWVQLDENPVATEIRAVSVDPASDKMYASLQNSYNLAGDRYNKEALAISADGGLTWTRTGPLAHGMDLAMHPLETETLYLGTFAQGLFKTTNAFGTWENVRVGNKLILDVEINPNNPNEILIAEVDIPLLAPGVFKSVDGGASWYASGVITATQIEYNTTNDLVYFSTENGIYVSDDNGESISADPIYFPGEKVLSLCFYDPFLYAGTAEGKLYRVDSEGLWEEISGDWNSPKPTEVRNILHVENSIVVGLNGAEQDTLHHLNGGVWQSVDGGISWVDITTNLTNTNVFGNTGMAASNDGQLYVGTYGQGIFKSADLVLGLEEENRNEEEALIIYPNPAHNALNIQVEQGIEMQNFQLFSAEGKLVYENRQPTANFSVNCVGFDKGVYLVKVRVQNQEINQKVVLY